MDGSKGCTETVRTSTGDSSLRVKLRLHTTPQHLDLLYPETPCPLISLARVRETQKDKLTAFHVIETGNYGFLLRDGSCKRGIYLVNCATKDKAANVQYCVDKNNTLCLQVVAKHGLERGQQLLAWYDVRNKKMFSP